MDIGLDIQEEVGMDTRFVVQGEFKTDAAAAVRLEVERDASVDIICEFN